MAAILLSAAQAVPAADAEAPPGEPIRIESGLISGAALGEKKDVRVYKGIPFAAPPVGELRWRAPQPATKWDGVRETVKFAPDPYQGDGKGSVNEDCLYLNVWTPAKSGKERLPVLVYIFGGGFQNGDGSEPRYDGANMARNGIVAVTVNTAYRSHELEYLVKQSDIKALCLIDGFRDSDYVGIVNELVPELKFCERGRLESARFPMLKSVIFIGPEKHRGMYNVAELLLLGDRLD